MTQLTGKAPELDLELDSEIADGIYSNLAIISHSACEPKKGRLAKFLFYKLSPL